MATDLDAGGLADAGSTGAFAATMVDAVEKHTGMTQGFRRGHARGLVCRGSFQATPEVRAFTNAEHFRGDVVPVQARLSNASGNAWAPDRASPRVGRPVGLGVRFQLPSGAVASWAAVSLPAFPARTPEDFLRLTRAQNPSGQPNPFKMIAYVLSRPSAFAALKAVATLPPVQSFAYTRFNGIHTYYLVSEHGIKQPFRYG